MTLNSLLTTFQKLIDVSIVWILVYAILKNLKNNIKMVMLLKGTLIILIIKLLSDYFNLNTTGSILEYIFTWWPIALIIIFQPEIRNALEQLGKKQILTKHRSLTMDEREKVVYEIMNAIDYMRKAKIGGLIAIEREISLNDYVAKSKTLYADISSELLISIFFPRNPLHDGGVIIQGNRITSAGAVFPISLNSKINKKLGTRHRAALGISEESDCIAIVISEETGKISIAINGILNYNLSLDDARMILIEELKPRKELLLDDTFEEEGESDNEEK
ncbi:MAG: diadenylate cyclase CdaA [Mycoplasmatota bacterium]|nr:diadenylate cyclase CdaA [Mycoplasmatota bacterium]